MYENDQYVAYPEKKEPIYDYHLGRNEDSCFEDEILEDSEDE
jgi:hypothetical protein